MLDMISVGDATLDVFLELNEADADVRCSIKNDECQLCLDYADKIPVESVIKIPGAGNGSNNAVGSARLQMKTAMLSILGDDETGHMISDNWKNEGISTKLVQFDKKRGTNYSTVLNYKGERTILVFHEKRDYRWPKGLAKSEWVYYTSLGKGSEKMHSAMVSYVKKNRVKLCFQPGTHQLKLGVTALTPVIAASEITVMNKEEMERLLGGGTKSMKDLLTSLYGLGCKLAVITDGPQGSFTYDGKKYLQIGIMEVPVIERTGCGDSYATAFVAALHHGKDIGEAMRWGTANAASVLGYVGPQKGLLKLTAMKSFLRKFAGIVSSEM
jgi:sugar/nucleoside kinase (ribokinase family)